MVLNTYSDPSNKQEIIATLAHEYLDGISVNLKTTALHGGFLKNKTDAVSMLLPTMIQSVFDNLPETIILSENFSRQLAFTHSHYKSKYSVKSDLILTSVLEDYVIQNADSVKNYLETNSDLLNFLKSVARKFRKIEDIKSIELEYYKDPEEDWDKLFITVRTQIEDMGALGKLDEKLFHLLFYPEMQLLSGRVVLSIE